jgi:hypothetical protein
VTQDGLLELLDIRSCPSSSERRTRVLLGLKKLGEEPVRHKEGKMIFSLFA